VTSDGDRLAPGTWLFGSPAEPAEESSGAAESPSATSPSLSSSSLPSTAHPSIMRSPAVAEEDPHDLSADEGGFARVSNVSMNALARRGLSVHELRDSLARREFSDEEIESEIDRLVRVGLLDDTELARTLVRTLRERKGLGHAALTAELRRRRLDGAAIETALAEADDHDEFARAHELAAKRAPQLRHVEPDAARRRLGGYLMRKGYSSGVVHAVVDRVLASTERTQGPRFE
jgi:SOS response regulatory protein OraA/RecX